eukprot:TRINITY_DN2813_c2_g3_i1.p2 TRINITY_DN2813_c2_g3~~TRINITY_DN2813_c2_g3_i1.p2  ORF type:complete len:251 (-),score=-7.01 TRINITY_DN2813_c2_g3_i1:701-1453(-)
MQKICQISIRYSYQNLQTPTLATLSIVTKITIQPCNEFRTPRGRIWAIFLMGIQHNQTKQFNAKYNDYIYNVYCTQVLDQSQQSIFSSYCSGFNVTTLFYNPQPKIDAKVSLQKNVQTLADLGHKERMGTFRKRGKFNQRGTFQNQYKTSICLFIIRLVFLGLILFVLGQTNLDKQVYMYVMWHFGARWESSPASPTPIESAPALTINFAKLLSFGLYMIHSYAQQTSKLRKPNTIQKIDLEYKKYILNL